MLFPWFTALFLLTQLPIFMFSLAGVLHYFTTCRLLDTECIICQNVCVLFCWWGETSALQVLNLVVKPGLYCNYNNPLRSFGPLWATSPPVVHVLSLSSPFYSSSSHLPSHNPLWLPLLHCTDACFDVCLVQGAISSLAACLWLQVWICVCVCQDTVKYFQGQGMSCIQCAQQVLEPKQQSEKRFLIWCHFEQDYLIYRCLLKPLDVTAIAVVMI